MVRQEVTVFGDVRHSPKYKLLLRPIGAYLDSLQATYLLLAESEEGFIWRCFPRHDPGRLLSGVIGHDEIPQLAEAMKRQRLGRVPDLQNDRPVDAVCRYGYEELLRCLSFKLDKAATTSMLLMEDDTSILVQYTLQVPMYVQMEPERLVMPHYFHEDVYLQPDIEALVKRARGFRGTYFYR